MTMTRRTLQVAAAALTLSTALSLSGCGSNEAVTEPTDTTTETESTVDPDITAEQLTFVEELLAEPLPQDEATARIEEAGYVWRLGTIDGEPQAVTMDYRIDRLTLTTQDGLVTDATWG